MRGVFALHKYMNDAVMTMKSVYIESRNYFHTACHFHGKHRSPFKKTFERYNRITILFFKKLMVIRL